MEKNKSHSTILTDGHLTLTDSLLFARPVSEGSVLTYTFKNEKENQQRTVKDAFLLMSLESIDIVLHGQWYIEIIYISQLTSLFAFLDYQKSLSNNKVKLSISDNPPQINTAILGNRKYFFYLTENENRSFISLLISSMLHENNGWVESLFLFVRGMESYWIAHFLLSRFMDEEQSDDSRKIYNACKKYGVSESYFRKLCNNAFICGPKKQLRIWRIAQSALQLIENDTSISIVASDNSYASSSHFSSEMKSIFGVTPGEFRKMVGLFHE